ncbi:restriction endonuclease subunit S [Nocardia farcinica]|nr:restriction endonuclease subunit S [Nocardia farcinica]MBF6371534.1 restriction endonuclease subunit S [Nocardia farcinica]
MRLGDVTTGVSTWNPSRTNPDDEFTYIDLSAIDQSAKVIAGPQRIVGSDAPSRARQLIHAGDILVSTVRPNLNAVAQVPEELDGATASTGFTVLRPSNSVDSRYIFQWVKTPSFVSDMVSKSTGASYPAVSDRIVKDSFVPLPPIDEQRRIAAILDHADALRAKRREALARLDELGDSVYADMFADMHCHSRQVRLDEVSEIVSGITKGRKVNGAPLRAVPYLAVANVQDKALDLAVVKNIEATDAEIERWRLQRDDLLLTEGGDPDKLGRGSLWREELPEAIHQNHVFRVRPDTSQVDPIYLNWAIGSRRGKAYFLRSAKQTTGIASINSTQLKAFPLELPSKDVQERFAQRVRAIDYVRDHYRTALAELDALFASLQSRAFRGEL